MPRVSLVGRVAGALRDCGVAPGARLLVAVSGGVDSMVLLAALARLQGRLGLRLHVAHVHHGLRGRAADRDAAFVVAEAARLGLGATVARLDPAGRRPGESVQVWAREARYRCLAAIADRVRAAHIAVAHTRDDQAETVLLNLLRGTGPRGLGGIPPVRDRILRPLLEVSRAEVEAYATVAQLPFRADASNASDAYRRNRVRHHLLPLLAKEYNPRIVESLASLAPLVREDDAALTAQAASLVEQAGREAGPAVRLDVAALRAAAPAVARRAFQAVFQRVTQGRHALTRRHLAALRLLLARGVVVGLPGGCEARREGAEIRIGPPADAAPAGRPAGRIQAAESAGEVPLRPGIWTSWPPLACRVRVRRLAAGDIPSVQVNPWQAVLSPRLMEEPLSLRGWRPGDRFRPLGMSGQKKLQDFFVDAKVPRRERGRIPLLVAGERIVWVVGHRIAENFRFRGRGTACLAEVEFSGDH